MFRLCSDDWTNSEVIQCRKQALRAFVTIPAALRILKRRIRAHLRSKNFGHLNDLGVSKCSDNLLNCRTNCPPIDCKRNFDFSMVGLRFQWWTRLNSKPFRKSCSILLQPKVLQMTGISGPVRLVASVENVYRFCCKMFSKRTWIVLDTEHWDRMNSELV